MEKPFIQNLWVCVQWLVHYSSTVIFEHHQMCVKEILQDYTLQITAYIEYVQGHHRQIESSVARRHNPQIITVYLCLGN